jgi:hypothetical protein
MTAGARGGSSERRRTAHQLSRREGLRHIVVGPDLQAHDLVDLGVASRQHDHRDVTEGADAAAHLDAVHAGQPKVEQHHPRAAVPHRVQPGGPVAGMDEPEAVLLEVHADQVGDGLLVLDQ